MKNIKRPCLSHDMYFEPGYVLMEYIKGPCLSHAALKAEGTYDYCQSNPPFVHS